MHRSQGLCYLFEVALLFLTHTGVVGLLASTTG